MKMMKRYMYYIFVMLSITSCSFDSNYDPLGRICNLPTLSISICNVQ